MSSYSLRDIVDRLSEKRAYINADSICDRGKLVAWGIGYIGDEVPEYIPLSVLERCEFDEVNNEIRDQCGTIWRDVRLIPLLYSTNASDLLDGCSILQVAEKYIIGSGDILDLFVETMKAAPEIGQSLAEQFSSHSLILNEGKLVKMNEYWPCIDAVWPRLTGKNFEESYQQTPSSLSELCRSLLHRYISLWRMLETGIARTDGIDPATSLRTPIDRYEWERPDRAIDLRTGDLIDLNTGALMRRSIVLHSQRIETRIFDCRTKQSNEAHPQPKGSTKGSVLNAVRVAFLELWPDDSPAGMGRKEIDAKIRERLGYRRDGDKPSERTIAGGIKLARAEIAERRR